MLLGYKKRFVEPILIGTKVFTLRARRKVQPKIGEKIHMYTGLRSANCELITNKEKLIGIQNARVLVWVVGSHKNDFKSSNGNYYVGDHFFIRIIIDGRELSVKEIGEFVEFDGFIDTSDFARYWLQGKLKKRTGATMQLFHWTDLKY